MLFITAQPNVFSIQLKVAGAVAIRKLNAYNEGDDLHLSWPAPSTGFKLQVTDGLGFVADWTFVTNSPQTSNGVNRLALPATNARGFYRLRLN